MGKFSEEVVAELHSVTETVQCQRARSVQNNMRVSITSRQRYCFHKALILHFNDADLMVHIVSADARMWLYYVSAEDSRDVGFNCVSWRKFSVEGIEYRR
jgi:hypothetical protein